MKKSIAVLCLLAGICAVVYYWIHRPGSATGEYYADYLPADTLATINLTDINTVSASFSSTSLGKFLAKEHMHTLFADLKAEQGEVARYDDLYVTVSDMTRHPAFRATFGEDAVVVLLNPDSRLLRENPETALRESLVLFAHSAASGALETFARLLMGDNLGTIQVDGHDLIEIQLDGDQTVYGYTEGSSILFTLHPPNIPVCLAVKTRQKGLQETPLFMAAKDYWQPFAADDVYGHWFVNMALLHAHLQEYGASEGRELAQYLRGVDSFAAVVHRQEEGINVSMRTRYRYDALDPMVQKMVAGGDVDNSSRALVSDATLVYQWSASLHSDLIREMFSVDHPPSYERLDRKVREKVGIPLSEIIAAIGPQYGMLLEEGNGGGLLPIPRMAFFLEIGEDEVGRHILEAIRAEARARGVSEKTEEVAGSTIYFWPILPGETTQPAVLLMDSMLYVANGPSILASVLERQAQRKEFAPEVIRTVGEAVIDKLSSANYGAFLLFPNRLAQEMEGMIGWLAGLVQMENGVSLEALSQDILDLMQSIDLIAVSSQLSRETADSEIFIRYAGTKEPK